MSKVILGMSGGVDSSVTAYLLREQGYEVEGRSFILWKGESQSGPSACCSMKAVEEVSKTAHYIGINHSVIDVSNDFMEKVINIFINAYTNGLTPNPCILCNRFIKFPFLLGEAEKTGAEYISTGHYAKVEKFNELNNPPPPPFRKGGIGGFKNSYFFLKKGVDAKKDQSYFLYVLRQEELKRLILPLGYYRKDEVRKIALELNLPAVNRAESQDICFIQGGNYSKLIEKLSSVTGKPGPIVDLNGKVIGTHKGVHKYTVGQRKRLGISSPEPLYVTRIDPLENIVYAGPCDAAKKKEFFVKDLLWIINPSSNKFRASVKVRSMMKEKPATVFHVSDENVRVVFDVPQWAPAPGESAVLYDDDIVVGGGIII